MTLQTLLDRFDLLMDTPESVPKLRRFILQLAVRGRLSDRRASDEPAETLVERMEAEKERLDAAGEYKYQKTMPPIEKDDIPFSFSVPKGWTWVRLGNLGKVYGGGTPKKSNSAYWGGEIPWVSPKDMSGAVIQSTEDKITQKGLEESSAKLVPPGSLLIVGRSGILERKLPVAVTAVECTANQDLKVLTPFVSGMARYIRLILKGFEPHILDELVKTGTTVRSLKYTEFQLHSYPLPPIDEQQRIVETVDGLMDECDALEEQQEREHALQVQVGTAATEALQSADDAESLRPAWERVRGHFDTVTATPEGVNALRQTILQLAVQGCLTERDPDDTPADVLLEEIQQEKQRLYDAGEIRKLWDIEDVGAADYPFSLPDQWEWARFNQVLYDIEAGWSPQCESYPAAENEWGVLKISAVSWGEFQPNENKRLPDSADPRHDIVVNEGDFLMSRANTEELVARSVVVDAAPPKLMMSDKVLRVWLSEMVESRYINMANNAPHARTHYAEEASGTSASMKNVSREVIRSLLLPIPPLQEQTRILNTAQQLLSLCDALEEEIERSHERGEQLLKAALRDASVDQQDGAPTGVTA
ncbi:type I restriction enzyme S subunit [Salinibacter ruber]|uniref:restriction endonuclease subunit S n=1 Tax=Salinibacter ruber TaxID=146919 RepID=UPI002169DA8F|nr:restriction endonuclease subunit S [Salinibacter ruber]MCS3708222.1 type I restriction enzyme S subunit [Salinibacter ruber]